MKKYIARLIPILYIALLLIIGLLQPWFPDTKPWIEITKIGLSWPVLLIVFLSSIILLFEEQLIFFLSKIKGIHMDKFSVSTQPYEEKNALPLEAVHKFIAIRDSEWKKTIDEVASTAQIAMKEKVKETENLERLINTLQQEINDIDFERIKWQFRYADQYLVGRTKLVLKIISLSERITLEGIWKQYEDIFNNLEERDAVFLALVEMNFIEKQLNEYYITKIGHLYINYLEEGTKVNWEILMNVLVRSTKS